MADEKASKPKKEKKGKGEAAPVTNASIAAHPRAKAGIRRARTRAAVGAFALVLVLNLVGNADPFDAIWRALVAGLVVNVIAWRLAILVWKHVIVSELRQAEDEYAARMAAARERLAEQARQQMQA